MTWIILMLLTLLAVWIGAGLIVLARNSRQAGNDYRRRVAGRVFSVGAEVEVELRLVPPAKMELADDHDVLLVIDHSGSMGSAPGSPLREAVRAAENFVRRLPDNIHTGVIGFDHEARLLSPITGNSRQSLRAIGSLGPGGGTAIHASLESSAEALRTGRTGVRKTIILLSDGSSEQKAAEAAVSKLRREIERLTIISVGFGPHVNESLLRSIASDPNKYVHITNADELHGLFGFLASAISGQMAIAGLIDEGARAPHPFRLVRTGGLYPIGVQSPGPLQTEATRIIWSLPLMKEEPVPLTYNLIAECPGWHRVAADGNSTWRMPDGTKNEMPGPSGPYVLIMPRWLGWTWPILNPLFWLLFGRFWRCRARAIETVALPEPEPLPAAAVPALPAAPNERPYQPKVRPAVVIGLGEVGEWTLCGLKERIQDRNVDPASVNLLAVHVTHKANRQPARVVNTMLDSHEQIDIHQDLRPYLETLRKNGTPPIRRWVPWRQWLAETPPLTTLRTVAGDRRKARLAIINRPEPVEASLAPGLQRVIETDGIVIVVGSIADAECSGLLAEIAHICASRGAGVTAIFAPTSFFETPGTAELALALELERISLMSGSQILSDRRDPPVTARQLFDRIIVVDQKDETAAEASRPTVELIWSMLAYEGVLKKLPLLRPEGGEAICCLADIQSHRIPAGSLWAWVRERTLALGVNGERLRLVEQDGKLVLPETDRDSVNNDVDAFWLGQYCTRPQSLLLNRLRPSMRANNSDMVSTLLALQEVVPFDLPYHEQAIHARNERQVFAAYLEEWCEHILAREREKNSWGLHTLMPALLRVASDMQLVIGDIKRLSGNPDFANLISFATGLLVDSLTIVSNARNDLSRWIARLIGPSLELAVDPPPDGVVPLAYDIENERQRSAKLLVSLEATEQELLEKWFKDWSDDYGDLILNQLSLRATREAGGQEVSIKLQYAGEELSADSDLAGALRTTLDRYRHIVFGWPLEQMLKSEKTADASAYFRVGKHSATAYPRVQEVVDEEDPFLAAVIRIRERSLKQALGVNPPPTGEIPYVWPEEANAARIAEKIRNRLRREPQPFSPTLVHLMRDTHKLHGFISDLANGRVSMRESKYVLQRDGEEYVIGPIDEQSQGLDTFQSVVQQVVSYEVSLNGQSIPPSSSNSSSSFEETIKAVENHSLGRMAVNSPNWKMWQDVIHGLWLEHNGDSH
ncbi:MAG TPA: VWA domain-containing protein [Pyrinomonadaceae bacterium]